MLLVRSAMVKQPAASCLVALAMLSLQVEATRVALDAKSVKGQQDQENGPDPGEEAKVLESLVVTTRSVPKMAELKVVENKKDLGNKFRDKIDVDAMNYGVVSMEASAGFGVSLKFEDADGDKLLQLTVPGSGARCVLDAFGPAQGAAGVRVFAADWLRCTPHSERQNVWVIDATEDRTYACRWDGNACVDTSPGISIGLAAVPEGTELKLVSSAKDLPDGDTVLELKGYNYGVAVTEASATRLGLRFWDTDGDQLFQLVLPDGVHCVLDAYGGAMGGETSLPTLKLFAADRLQCTMWFASSAEDNGYKGHWFVDAVIDESVKCHWDGSQCKNDE